jgi:hypothetical protein
MEKGGCGICHFLDLSVLPGNDVAKEKQHNTEGGSTLANTTLQHILYPFISSVCTLPMGRLKCGTYQDLRWL